MEAIPQLLPIEKNTLQINKEVLTNTLKMIKERKLIDEIPQIDFTQLTHIIPTKDGNYHIKVYKDVLSSINKAPELIDFLKANDEHKILIVEEINNKTEQTIKNMYNVEIFLEKNLMINLVDYIMVPKHEVLTDEEAEKVIEEYKIKKVDLPKILLNDPVAKYYNMKLKQICRITRPSETAGYGFYYRIVENPIIIKKK